MNETLIFAAGTLIMATISILAVFKTPKNAANYFKTAPGKKVFKGILIFVAFGCLVSLIFSFKPVKADEPKFEWLAYGEVFIGIDHTLKQSPQCFSGGPNDYLTSNGGVRVNILQSPHKRVELNSKYTHHSCAFSPDRERYDSIGVELNFRLW